MAFGTNIAAARSHYINSGYAEGRIVSGFNATNYLSNYIDLSNAFGNNTEAAIRHYINAGYAEGRTDKSFYKISNRNKKRENSLNFKHFISDKKMESNINLENLYSTFGDVEGKNNLTFLKNDFYQNPF